MNITVDTKNIYEEFQSHLIQSDNERILFSSAFGTGKSTFLTEYFTNHPEYNVFRIYPVSYSVVNNEDIFELIKYDVLFQLFERSEEGQLDLINEDYSQILAFQFKFLRQAEYTPILFKLLELADKTGKYSVIEKVIAETRRQYESFKAKHKDEQEEIYNFLFQQYSKKGSPKEKDLVSQLIRDLLYRLKTSEKIVQSDYDASGVENALTTDDTERTDDDNLEVENVLIIDDLDRLDPEHIFRLFNVFSVNFGSNEIENKFGFDKIIFVCDLENIRKIYEHRYGQGVDFEGYIDKFYSTNPFKFNTNKLLSKYVTDLLQGFNIPSTVIDFTDRRTLDYHPTFVLLRCIINELIANKKLNLRKLLNSTFFSITDRPFAFNRYERHQPMQFPIIIVFQILEGLFDSQEVIEETLKLMSKTFDKNTFGRLPIRSDNSPIINLVMEETILFIIDYDELHPHIANLRSTDKPDLSLKVIEKDVWINFIISLNFGSGRETQFTFLGFSDKSGNRVSDVNLYDILATAYRRCKNLDIF